jgi:hypothetical protein
MRQEREMMMMMIVALGEEGDVLMPMPMPWPGILLQLGKKGTKKGQRHFCAAAVFQLGRTQLKSLEKTPSEGIVKKGRKREAGRGWMGDIIGGTCIGMRLYC